MEIKIIWLIVFIIAFWLVLSEFSDRPEKRKLSKLVEVIAGGK